MSKIEKIKLKCKQLLGKEYKFFWRRDTFIGNLYGVILNRLGMKLLNLGRKMIRKGGGKFRNEHYQNCSWCGGVQNVNTGLHMHISNKGLRCGCTPIECNKQPKV